jgi:hypothetical protein
MAADPTPQAPATDGSSAPIVTGAIAAWALPGLGHVLTGRKRRGFILMAAIMGLYLMGLLIGGIDVVDRSEREDRLWYAAQFMAGPTTILVDAIHQRMKAQTLDRTRPTGPGGAAEDRSAYTVSIGRVNEMGTLYCALAGLLNLLVIIDLAWSTPAGSDRTAPQPALRGRVVTRQESA